MPHFEKVAYSDDLGRVISQECRHTTLELMKKFVSECIPLPLPLPSGDPEENQCIYLQWRNASLYVYHDHFVFWDIQTDNGLVPVNNQETLFEIIKKACVKSYDDLVFKNPSE
jgi:hypothetical protein